MKKVTIILLLSVVAVCGIVAFKVWNAKPAKLHQEPLSQIEVKPPPQATPAPTPKPIQELSIAEKIRLSFQKTDESMARLRNLTTPEARAAMRKRQFEKIEQDYEAFFQTLELEQAAIHQAVDIILDRESKYLDIYDTLNEVGMSKGIKDFGQNRKIEQSVAEVQLRHLLGDEHYETLVQFEKERQAQMLSKAQKIISKHLND